MKKIINALIILLAISCSDNEFVRTESVLKIRANVSGINDIGYVKTWVMNTLTFERQWVILTQQQSTNIWEVEVTLKNGDYSLETLVQSKLSEPIDIYYPIVAYVKQMQFKVKRNVTVSFANFNDNPPFRPNDFDNHTVLTSCDPCNLMYKIFMGNDLCDSHIIVDRQFSNVPYDDDILSYSFKELWIGDGACIQHPDRVADTGVLTGEMLPYQSPHLDAEFCAAATEEAEIIDAAITSGGTLKNGQEFEIFDIVYYKLSLDDGGRVTQKNKKSVRNKFLP